MSLDPPLCSRYRFELFMKTIRMNIQYIKIKVPNMGTLIFILQYVVIISYSL